MKSILNKTILLSMAVVSSGTMQANAWRFFWVVRNQERVVIERLGKEHRILQPGLRFVIPLLDQARVSSWGSPRIDMRETALPIPSHDVITNDNVTTHLVPVIYFTTVDPVSTIYRVENLNKAIKTLTQTTLRNVVGKMDLDDAYKSRDEINRKLKEALEVPAQEWGISVNRVELLEIKPAENFAQDMEKQMRAERERRVAILNAEGDKKAQITRAEGEMQAKILEAQGYADALVKRAHGEAAARLAIAKAEAESLEMVQNVLGEKGNAAQYRAMLEYIAALPKMANGGGKVVVPYEMSPLAGLIASLKIVDDSKNK